MVSEIVLHIGMHKTGTTSIQAALNNFDDGRVRYARLNDVNHSIPIYSLFSKNKYAYHIHTGVGRTVEEIDTINNNTIIDLERELNLDREKIIISGEDISTLEADEVQSLVSWLRARTSFLKVVAYVRDPLGFASSALQQYIYGGTSSTSVPTPDYKKRFEAYTQCAEVDAIEFVEFKKNELVDGSVVADFCSRVGFDGSSLTERRTNESMSLECTQLLYHLNKFGIQTRGNADLANTRRLFSHFLSQNFKGDSFKIPKNLVWAAMEMADITWMEKVSGIQLVPTDLVNANLSKSESCNVLEETISHIQTPTLLKLREIVSEVDGAVGTDSNITNLLNFLFASLYFKETYTREKAEALAVEHSRQEKLVDQHARKQAELHSALEECRQEIELARIANEELSKRENEAKAIVVALEQRGLIARLLNKPSQSIAA